MDKAEHSDEGTCRVEPIRRRRFLGGLGAGGLTLAGAMFGSAAPADAASCGCCNLVYCPPNTTLTSCRGTQHYLWSCGYPGSSTTCSCCEKINNRGYYASAYQCNVH